MTDAKKPSWLRRGLIGLAWAVTIIALLCAINAWHARRAWNAYRTSYEAHAGSLDLKSFVPPDVPEAENFAAIPMVRTWFDPADTNFPFANDHFSRVAAAPAFSLLCVRGGSQQHVCDLVAWRDAFAAADRAGGTNRALSGQFDPRARAQAAPAVLEALQDDDGVWTEFRRVSNRPRAKYPIEYIWDDPWSIRLPHLAKIKGACLRLELKACAESALNQSTNALADVELGLYLADTLKDEPFLISWLVRIACVQAALGPVWEGLAEHRWSDAQLREVQGLLERYDFPPGLQRSLRGERAAGVLTVDILGRKDMPYLNDLSQSVRTPLMIARLAPPGWRDQEKLEYCRLFDLLFDGVWDVPARRFSPRRVDANAAALQGSVASSWETLTHHRLIARMLLPPLGRPPFKAATAQTAINQAVIACALERYRLANGQFPGELGALVPKYLASLPNDVVTGASYQYQRAADGRFTLSSVGGDDKKVAGIPDKGVWARLSQSFAVQEGDWVWSYPRE